MKRFSVYKAAYGENIYYTIENPIKTPVKIGIDNTSGQRVVKYDIH
jgi:hypothetical protein